MVDHQTKVVVRIAILVLIIIVIIILWRNLNSRVKKTEMANFNEGMQKLSKTGHPGDVLTLASNGVPTFLPLDIPTPTPSGSSIVFTPLTQIVYVRKEGSDTDGDGTIAKPYLTITHAMATITDALWEKRYMIDLGPGNWADNFSWKAWVFMRGSYLYATRLTGAIDINDSSWAVPGSHSDERAGAQDINFSGTMSLDYASIGSSYGKFYYMNCNMNNTLVINGMHPVNQCVVFGGFWFGGITSTACAITWVGVSGQGGTIALQSSPIASSFVAFGGGHLGNLSVTRTSNTAPIAMLINFPILGNLTVSGVGASVSATSSSLPPQSNIVVSGGGSITLLNEASGLGYNAANSGNWNGSPPQTVSAALDRLAAVIGVVP